MHLIFLCRPHKKKSVIRVHYFFLAVRCVAYIFFGVGRAPIAFPKFFSTHDLGQKKSARHQHQKNMRPTSDTLTRYYMGPHGCWSEYLY